jgi:hypothetical protein
MFGIVAAYVKWNAAHYSLTVRVGSTKFVVRRPTAPSYEYTPLIKVDVNSVLGNERRFDIPQGKLADGLHQLFSAGEFPTYFWVKDVKGVRGAAVKGRLSYRAALQMMLAGTGCRYEVMNRDLLAVWCKTHPDLTRAAEVNQPQAEMEQGKTTTDDVDLPLRPIPSTEIHPEGLQVDAYVDTRTLRVHIPAGEAQFTLPAFQAIARLHATITDLPANLLYEMKVVAGHHTRAVDGPLPDAGILNTMLEGSGLRWRQVDTTVRITAIPSATTDP